MSRLGPDNVGLQQRDRRSRGNPTICTRTDTRIVVGEEFRLRQISGGNKHQPLDIGSGHQTYFERSSRHC